MVRGTDTDFIKSHPHTAELVIEVAVSSAELDRENATLYAEAGVTEYWIVLGSAKQIEVYHRPQAGVYQEKRTLGIDDVLKCAGVPIQIRVADIFP